MDLPQWGGDLVKLTSLFTPIGQGFHGSALSGQGFGHTGKPTHSTCADSPKKVLHQDFASKQRVAGWAGEALVQWCCRFVCWMVLDGLLDVSLDVKI